MALLHLHSIYYTFTMKSTLMYQCVDTLLGKKGAPCTYCIKHLNRGQDRQLFSSVTVFNFHILYRI